MTEKYRKVWLILAILPVFLLTGCASVAPTQQSKSITLSLGSKDFSLETARTDDEKKLGLGLRQSLDKNSGMIFYFDRREIQSFWMKDTYIPLQIIFIDGCTIVDIQEMTVEPDPSNPVSSYQSKTLADKVIELNKGSVSASLVGTRIDNLCQ